MDTQVAPAAAAAASSPEDLPPLEDQQDDLPQLEDQPDDQPMLEDQPPDDPQAVERVQSSFEEEQAPEVQIQVQPSTQVSAQQDGRSVVPRISVTPQPEEAKEAKERQRAQVKVEAQRAAAEASEDDSSSDDGGLIIRPAVAAAPLRRTNAPAQAQAYSSEDELEFDFPEPAQPTARDLPSSPPRQSITPEAEISQPAPPPAQSRITTTAQTPPASPRKPPSVRRHIVTPEAERRSRSSEPVPSPSPVRKSTLAPHRMPPRQESEEEHIPLEPQPARRPRHTIASAVPAAAPVAGPSRSAMRPRHSEAQYNREPARPSARFIDFDREPSQLPVQQQTRRAPPIDRATRTPSDVYMRQPSTSTIGRGPPSRQRSGSRLPSIARRTPSDASFARNPPPRYPPSRTESAADKAQRKRVFMDQLADFSAEFGLRGANLIRWLQPSMDVPEARMNLEMELARARARFPGYQREDLIRLLASLDGDWTSFLSYLEREASPGYRRSDYDSSRGSIKRARLR